MRRPPITAILTAGACALGVAAPAAAQESAGQRYLAWPTKTAAASGPAAYVANPAADAPRRRAPIIPHGGFGRMPDTAPAQNLTPASAWLGPNAPTYQPVPPPQPYPAPRPALAPPPTSWSRDLTPPAPAPAPPPPPPVFGVALIAFVLPREPAPPPPRPPGPPASATSGVPSRPPPPPPP